LGGGTNGVAQLIAGGLSGVLAMSTLIATGVVPVGGGSPARPQHLPITFCQGDRVLAVAQPGEQMLVTGKSADGVFYRVYVPGPLGGNEGWVRSVDVNLLAEGPIPVAGCGTVAEVRGTPPRTAIPATASPGLDSTGGPSPTPATTATARASARPTARPTPSPTPATAATAKPTAKPTPTPNLGPVFTTQPRSIATTMGTNPLGSGTCIYPVSIELTTAATDPDGVMSIQLWVQKPRATSFVRLGHDFTRDGALWYASISTAKDRLPDEGRLDYYAVAIDSKGVERRSATASVDIQRCDTEATISGGINLNIRTNGHYYIISCTIFSIPWRYTVTDPDTVSRVSIKYSITHTGAPTLSTTIGLRHRLDSNLYFGSSVAPAIAKPYYGANYVAWTVTSMDPYEESTTTRTRKAIVDLDTCVD